MAFERRYNRTHGFRRGSWRLRLIPIGLFALFLIFYYFSHQETVPITGRNQLVAMSLEQETTLGYQSYQQVLSQEHVLHGGETVEHVNKIGQQLARATQDVDPGFVWEFNVIQSPQVNAFALPGGKVAVYTGILDSANNEDGLAAVLGHEIAHAIARHGAERMAYQKLIQWASMAVSIALGDLGYDMQRAVMGAFGLGSKYGVLLPFSRSHESEADKMGLIFMAKACFDPKEAPKLWQRMAKNSQSKSNEFMSTHPSHETRVKQLNEWMPEAEKIYAEHCSQPAARL